MTGQNLERLRLMQAIAFHCANYATLTLSQHIDIMFLKDNGHTYVDDDAYSISNLFTEANNTMPAFHYIYDLVSPLTLLATGNLIYDDGSTG